MIKLIKIGLIVVFLLVYCSEESFEIPNDNPPHKLLESALHSMLENIEEYYNNSAPRQSIHFKLPLEYLRDRFEAASKAFNDIEISEFMDPIEICQFIRRILSVVDEIGCQFKAKPSFVSFAFENILKLTEQQMSEKKSINLNGFSKMKELLQHYVMGYSFLVALEKALCSESAKGKSREGQRMWELIQDKSSLTDANLIKLKSFLQTIGFQRMDGILEFNEFYSNISNVRAILENDTQTMNWIGEVRKLLHKFWSHDVTHMNFEDQKLLVKGKVIKVSDVVAHPGFEMANYVEIIALDKILIDADISKTSKDGFQMIIIAPEWHLSLDWPSRSVIKFSFMGADGDNLNPAPNGTTHNRNGENGMQGQPGYPGGNFYGIGELCFAHGHQLEIISNGGKGGNGQNGGRGADGINGTVPDCPPDVYRRDPKRCEEYWTPPDLCKCHGPVIGTRWHEGKKVQYVVYNVSSDCIQPGNGGMGGKPGIGGHPGDIFLNWHTPYESNKIVVTRNKGLNGAEGIGGEPGFKSYDILKEFYFRNDSRWHHDFGLTILPPGVSLDGRYIYAYDCTKVIEIPNEREGKRGRDNFTDGGWECQPKESIGHIGLVDAVDNFKKAWLQYALDDGETIIGLCDRLQTQFWSINLKYEAKDFIDEYLMIETEYNGNSRVKRRFMESLLEKIKIRTNIIDGMTEENEVLVALNEMILARKFILQYPLDAAITNLSKYLTNSMQNIRNEVNNFVEIDDLRSFERIRDDYQNTIQGRIDEGLKLIENTLRPNFDKIAQKLVDAIKSVIAGLSNARTDIEGEKEKNIQARNYVKKAIWVKAGATALKVASLGLKLSKPNKKIDDLARFSMGLIPANSAALRNPEMQQLMLTVRTMNQFIQESDEMKAQRTLKAANIFSKCQHVSSEKIEKVVRIIRSMNDLRKICTENTSELQQIHNAINKGYQRLKELINGEKTELNNKQYTQRGESRISDFFRLAKAQSIIQGVDVIMGEIQPLLENYKMLEILDEWIKRASEDLIEIEKYEENIIVAMFPMVEQISNLMESTMVNSTSQSHAELSITNWDTKNSIKFIQQKVQKMIKGFPPEIHVEFEGCFEKLDEALSLVLDIYHNVDDNRAHGKFANYVAALHSPRTKHIKINDAQLKNKFDELRERISKNILLEYYENSLKAFKHHQFPFAVDVLNRFAVPDDMKKYSKELLVENTIFQLGKMQEFTEERRIHLHEYSEFIHANKRFDGTASDSPAFYRWKNKNIKNEMKKLLSGEEITIMAHIHDGPDFNAIKFNDIGIRFKVNGEKLQNDLDRTLSTFMLKMTMAGKSHYRWNNEIYYIAHDKKISISYAMKKNSDEIQDDPNHLYQLIIANDPFLSPYTTWTIQLKNTNSQIDFHELKRFENKTIDLQLIGKGSYVELNCELKNFVHSENLDKHYKREESLSNVHYLLKEIDVKYARLFEKRNSEIESNSSSEASFYSAEEN